MNTILVNGRVYSFVFWSGCRFVWVIGEYSHCEHTNRFVDAYSVIGSYIITANTLYSTTEFDDYLQIGETK